MPGCLMSRVRQRTGPALSLVEHLGGAVTISSRTCFSLTIVFIYKLRSRTLCAQWTYHVTPGSLTRMFPSGVTCSRLVYLYVSVPVSRVSLHYLFGLTTRLRLLTCLMLSLYISSTRLCLPLLLMITCYSLSTRYSWTMTHLPFMNICNCISQFTIYTIGDGDSSLIFNLLCNHPKGVTCEIPRPLLVLSSSLAKATALRP